MTDEEQTQDNVKKINGLKVWDKDGKVFVSPTFSRVPFPQWKEWEDDCKERFGDSRWAKAWNDHQAAKEDYKFKMISDKIDNILLELESLKAKPEEVSDRPKTLGHQE